jgi:alpha-N-arabinofuranosidase
VNIDSRNTQEISIDLHGKKFTSITGRILTSDRLQDFNSFDQPNKIQPRSFSDARLKDNMISVKLPPFSVVVLELK